ncbi:hypothetical protein [Cardinium endosymbiont of Philonthus spinipes]|uniref:hypothetical protein n=1 Tax=Cardinium endosymbiont of Philonthus spinipes TaxID=3077941 RepID=UPI00313AD9A3
MAIAFERIRYLWLKKQVANPLPAAASPSIKNGALVDLLQNLLCDEQFLGEV